MMMKVLLLPGILFLILHANVALGQKGSGRQREHAIYLPKAILVQLRSEKKKINYFEKAGNHKEAAQVREDVQGVNNAMISDFTDNFKFCPFYFFVDTNIELIKAKKFDGVLLNSDMKPASDLVVNANSKDYFIVYYGIPEREKINKNGEMAGRNVNGEGLVVAGYDYIQLEKPSLFYYYTNRGYYHLHSKNSKYSYSSKKYNIEYYALAGEMFEDFKDYFRTGK